MSVPLVLAPKPGGGRSPARGAEPVRFAGIRLVHAAVRRDLLQFAAALRSLGPGDEARGYALARHWSLLARTLIDYHGYQDARVWPVLRRRIPELRLLANWLEADHHELERLLDGVTATVLATARTRRGAWMAAQAVQEFGVELQRHLRIEETQVLSVMRRAFHDESGSLPDMLQWIPSADGPSTADLLAWLLDGVHEDVVDGLLQQCDDAVVRSWPHWRDTYARCTAEMWTRPLYGP